ncbi:hypothetical protein DFH08DRAFT_681680, partial [Mycena albidolilacea]
KTNKIPPMLRQLMRLVAEVAPHCATTSKQLALHILTTQQGKTHCCFHNIKCGTKGEKESDGPVAIVRVVYSKAVVPTQNGFLHCGCDEQAALWEFFWFKTWTMISTNPKIKGFDRMGRDTNNVLTSLS